MTKLYTYNIIVRALCQLREQLLLRLLDQALEKDQEYESRNELIESFVLKYLESKGKL